MTILFADGKTSEGKHIGLFNSEIFKGSIKEIKSYLEYTGLYSDGTPKISHIALLNHYGNEESIDSLYPVHQVVKIY